MLRNWALSRYSFVEIYYAEILIYLIANCITLMMHSMYVDITYWYDFLYLKITTWFVFSVSEQESYYVTSGTTRLCICRGTRLLSFHELGDDMFMVEIWKETLLG